MSLWNKFPPKKQKEDPFHDDLGELISNLKKLTENLKENSDTIRMDLIEKLEETAKNAQEILIHRDAITNLIINPVGKELTKGKYLAYLGLVAGVIGLATTPVGLKYLSPIGNLLNDTQEQYPVITSTNKFNYKQLIQKTNDVILSSIQEKSSKKIDQLLTDFRGKLNKNKDDLNLLSVLSYAHVLDSYLIKKNKEIAYDYVTRDIEKFNGSEICYQALSLFKIELSTNQNKIDFLEKINNQENNIQLQIISLDGRLTSLSQYLNNLEIKSLVQWLVDNNRRVVVINDSIDKVDHLAKKTGERLNRLFKIPMELIDPEDPFKNSRRADKVYVYYMSERDKKLSKHFMKSLTNKYKHSIEASSKSKNAQVIKLRKNKNIGIIMRIPGVL